MRLLDRYLLRELLIPLAYCLCGFLIFWVFSDLFSQMAEFQRKKLVAHDIIAYYLVSTPEFLVVVVPIALLLALLYALTNHARHHEITAMRAAGVSLWRLCLPYFALGLLASIVLFAVNEFWVPKSAEAADQILTRRLPPKTSFGRAKLVKCGFSNSASGRVWQIGVYDLKSGEMMNPKVFSKQ